MSRDEATTDEAKTPKRGVGTVAQEAIKAGKTNEEALEAVKAEFPDANTTLSSVNWYRNKMRAENKSIPTSRELKAKAKEAAAPEGGDADPLD